MAPHNEETYDVGFRKPPKRTQFSKGVSGNPKGRPKGSRNLATVLEKALRKRVVVNENGVRRTVTKLEAALTQMVNQAASGDLTAMRQLTALANTAEEQQPVSQTSQNMVAAELKIMESVLKRSKGCEKGENDHENE